MFRVRIERDFPKPDGVFSLKVDFETDSRVLVVFGASGSGKSLTLKMMAGLIAPRAGFVQLGGRVLYDSAAGVDLPARARRVGYVFQDYALFPHMTVRQNVAFGLGSPWKALGRSRSREVDELLERFEIDHLAESLPRRISGGQRQRTALARALAMKPEALFLDEPLSALDPLLRRRVRADLLATLERTEIPAVLISHDPDDVEAFAGSLAVMDSGHMVELLDYPTRRAHYGSAFEMLEDVLEHAG